MKDIVIIGAGYGGLRALEYLAKEKNFKITLIDKNPYHYMQTEAYGYIAGRFDISDIAIDLNSFVKGLGDNVSFIKDKAIKIDKEKQILTLENQTIVFDYAIIAVGAQTNFFSFIKGAKEYTHGVKNIQRAFEFRQAFEKRLYLKLEEKKLHRNGDLHIAIAGAGLSGVEIAAEMAHTLKKYEKILSKESITLKISLIDAAKTILPGMDSYIINKTEQRLKTLGIQIYTNAFIQEIKERSIYFKDGTKVDFDFIIYTAGIKAAKFIQEIQTEKNNIEQIIPDEYLHLQGSENIFCIGDCTQIKSQEKLLPPTAQTAEKSAQYVAKAIIAKTKNKSYPIFKAKIDGYFVALGGNYAIGMLYEKIKVEGYLAYLLKKLITRVYRHGLEIKVNAGYKKR